MSFGTSPHGVAPTAASPRVTAGLRCATPPVTARLATTPAKTAMAHAQVMTTHPAFCAFDCVNKTPATTPSPSRIRTAVPTTSPTNILRTTPYRTDRYDRAGSGVG